MLDQLVYEEMMIYAFRYRQAKTNEEKDNINRQVENFLIREVTAVKIGRFYSYYNLKKWNGR